MEEERVFVDRPSEEQASNVVWLSVPCVPKKHKNRVSVECSGDARWWITGVCVVEEERGADTWRNMGVSGCVEGTPGG